MVFHPVASKGGAILSSPVGLIAVADLKIETVRILHVKTEEVFAVVVGDRIKPTALESRFDLLGIPRCDADTEAIPNRTGRPATSTTATAPAASTGRPCCISRTGTAASTAGTSRTTCSTRRIFCRRRSRAAAAGRSWGRRCRGRERHSTAHDEAAPIADIHD